MHAAGGIGASLSPVAIDGLGVDAGEVQPLLE